ncbi:hypothetical protein [Henriciella pelagia]|uniref:hypothetical protein n=1 Tax=Henriciella pelagia TaxID=1977912 RepID=UPI0035196110
MTTKTRVFNNALRLLGQPPCSSPDDTSNWVQRVANAYPDVLQAWMEDHSWNFAMTVQQLAVVTPTLPGWTYSFNKPARCRRIIKVTSSSDRSANPIAYDDRQGKILSNSETTYLWFVDGSYEDHEGSWSQKFANALSALLADDVYPITDESDSTRSRIDAAVRRRVRDAKAWDATSKREWPIPAGRYERARVAGIRTPRAGRYG